MRAAAHPLQHPLDMRDRRLRQNAVAEIEDERAVGERLITSSTSRSSAAPPASSASGSRLPCTATCGCRISRAQTRGRSSSRGPTALTPVQLGIRQRHRAGAARKADDLGARHLRAHALRRSSASAAMHQRSNSSGGRTPAQVSKICTTSTPALSWPTRYSTEPRTSRSISRAKASGSR